MRALSDIPGSRTARRIVRLFDAASILIVSAIVALGFAEPAHAYVDPSVMTYTIQALAGVAVALGAVASVALRRTRKWLFKALNIDENANKDVEGDICRISTEEAAALDAETPVYTELATTDENKELSWKSRFGIAFLVVLLCGFTLGISAPFELVAGNASNLTYGLKDIWPVMVIATLVGVIVLSGLVSLLKGKAFRVVTLLLCCCGVCMYVQALFMNSGLILNDNQDIDWGSYLPIMVVSAIIWLAILIVPQILGRRNQRVTRIAVIGVSVCLILVQAIGVGSLFLTGETKGGSVGPSITTQQGMLEVSDKGNVIYLIIDHLDERELEHLLDEHPDLLDFLPNSTVYTNAMEVMTPTEFALPYMVTDVLPEVDEDINGSYLWRRYTEGEFLKALSDSGYAIGIYTDALRLYHLSNADAWDSVGRYTENIHPTENQHLSWKGTLKILVKAALYRDLPWVMKPSFLYTTADLNDHMVARGEARDGDDEQPYVCNDFEFYEKLLEEGLSIDEDDNKGNLRFIHFDGNHSPWTKNENVEEVEHSPEGRDADALGAFKIVETYIQQLKDLGVYDKSTIIITADHGDWETQILASEVSVPMLIVKPATDGSEQNAPVYSDAPVSHADLFATMLEAMGGNGSRFGSSVAEIEAAYGADPASRTRETYMAAANKGYTKIVDLFLFTVQGDALDWDAWTYTGITWHVEDGD